MDVDAGALVRVLGEHAREQRDLQREEHVGEALERDREHAGVGEDDLVHAARGRVALVGGGDVGLHQAAHFRQGAEKLGGESVGGGNGVGHFPEAQALLDLGREPALDLGEQLVEPRGGVGLGQAAILEEAREEEMHQVARQFIDAVLRGQVGAVEVVDPAALGIGFEQGELDGLGDHGRTQGRGWPESFAKK